jgi:hypothetical protein
LALLDEDEMRAFAVAPRNELDGVAILEFGGKNIPYVEMASFTGGLRLARALWASAVLSDHQT